MELKNEKRKLEGETLLRQCQLVELEILDEFVKLCEKYQLRYFLNAGTLLGAVRHGGFIPWDDDVDVAMPMEDFKKFIRLTKNDIPDHLYLQIPGKEPGVIEGFGKLMDRRSFFCQAETDVRVPCGIYIDIFPFIRVPALPKKLEAFLTYWSYQSWMASQLHKNLPHRFVVGLLLSAVKSLVWRTIFHSIRFVYFLLRPFYPEHMHDPFTACPVAAGVVSVPEDKLLPTKKMMFEGKLYNVPNDPDAYLTQHYGDWRTLPPPEKRHWHASIICPTQAPDQPWARKYE